jgi:hypothetical protein
MNQARAGQRIKIDIAQFYFTITIGEDNDGTIFFCGIDDVSYTGFPPAYD